MEKDNSLIELNKMTTKIFEDIKDICENYLGDSILTDTNPDMFIIMIKDKISEYDKIQKEFDNMDRTEKIDVIVEFLDENHIMIIDKTSIGSIIVDADQSLDKVDNKYEYDELLEKGLTDGDIESFKKFLEKNTLMMIKTDEISGVSFENSEYNIDDFLYDTDLWNDEAEEDEKCEDEN